MAAGAGIVCRIAAVGAWVAEATLILWDVVAVYFLGLYEVIRQQRRSRRSALGLYAEDSDVAIVTGGAEGIGFHISRQLALLGMSVFIAGPDTDAGRNAVAAVKAERPTASVEYLELDLSSFQSVRKFVKNFLAYQKPLHVLINNAGIMMTPLDPCKTLNDQIAVNYVGHFLLTRLLLGKLAATGVPDRQARVVNMSSIVHHLGDAYRVISNKPRSSHSSYCDSKLAIVMSTYYLDQLLRTKGLHVTATCVHPGVVASGLYRNIWWPLRKVQMNVFAPFFFKTAEEGASTVLFAAASTETQGIGGVYFDDFKIAKTSRQSYDIDQQQSLWNSTSHLVGVITAI